MNPFRLDMRSFKGEFTRIGVEGSCPHNTPWALTGVPSLALGDCKFMPDLYMDLLDLRNAFHRTSLAT